MFRDKKLGVGCCFILGKYFQAFLIILLKCLKQKIYKLLYNMNNEKLIN